MKITYKQAIEAQGQLLALNQILLPVKESLKLARLTNFINSEIRLYIEARDKLLRQYKIKREHDDKTEGLYLTCELTPSESENAERFKEKKLKEFDRDFNELLDTETADYKGELIKLPETFEFKGHQISAVECFLEV
jgi:hypothetical protein